MGGSKYGRECAASQNIYQVLTRIKKKSSLFNETYYSSTPNSVSELLRSTFTLSMGGIPNHTFSIKKDRELSSLEVRINSVRRHFSNSGARNGRRSQEGEVETNLVSVSSSHLMMQRRRRANLVSGMLESLFKNGEVWE